MDEGYKELAAAIVERAVWDYRNALKYKKKSEIHSLEKFFLSGWFELLSDYDGDEIMRIIRRGAA